jgi:methyltransferase
VSLDLSGADQAAIAILALVSVQRLLELVYGRANETRLRAKGAIEFGRLHYPAIVGLHAAWLIGLWWFAWNRSPDLAWFAIFVVLQILRIWVLRTLGERWTTRILVLPGAPLVRAGPYRYFSHPNYAVVVGELFALPMVFGLLWYAILFSLLNAAMLAVRIRAEDRALHQLAQPPHGPH